MIAKQGQVNIDRLKVCYKHNQNLYDDLIYDFNLNKDHEITDSDHIIELDGFRLVLLGHDKEGDKIIKMIVAIDIMDNEITRLGHFKFSIVGMFKGYTFFEFENKALYTPFTIIKDKKSNLIHLINYISTSLRLEFNNISLTELPCDTNINFIGKLRKAIKNTDKYDMFINGNLIKDPKRTIKNYGEYYSRSREQISRQPTLYFSQAKDTGISMRIYNKSRQMQESEPAKLNYIPQWLSYGTQSIYRAEITLRNDDINDFLIRTGNDKSDALYMLLNEEWRTQLWAWACHRLMFFRDKHTGKDIELWDLL